MCNGLRRNVHSSWRSCIFNTTQANPRSAVSHQHNLKKHLQPSIKGDHAGNSILSSEEREEVSPNILGESRYNIC
eukprot:3117226-Rhodomonas_salina.1